MPKQKKHKNIANPEMAKAMRDLRTSNAAGTHLDKRTKRIRTRQASKQKNIKENLE